jgi:hypothetical protein
MNKEHIEFSTIREDFNQYQVENGQLLKVKVMLTDIAVETADDEKKTSLIGIKDLSAIITDVKIDTSDLEYASMEEVTEKDIVKELNFRPIREIVKYMKLRNF